MGLMGLDTRVATRLDERRRRLAVINTTGLRYAAWQQWVSRTLSAFSWPDPNFLVMDSLRLTNR